MEMPHHSYQQNSTIGPDNKMMQRSTTHSTILIQTEIQANDKCVLCGAQETREHLIHCKKSRMHVHPLLLMKPLHGYDKGHSLTPADIHMRIRKLGERRGQPPADDACVPSLEPCQETMLVCSIVSSCREGVKVLPQVHDTLCRRHVVMHMSYLPCDERTKLHPTLTLISWRCHAVEKQHSQ